jgi:uncharacterized protein DUF7010
MASQPATPISKEPGQTAPSSQALAIIGAGRGAVVRAMFGSGWLGWGLGVAKAYNGFVAPIFGFTMLFLLAYSIHIIRTGRLLRKRYPASDTLKQKIVRNKFLWIVLVEVLAIALVAVLANRLHRGDLATDWCAMIVGLHYLPLAKIFRAPHYAVLSILMTLWCVICWALFRSNALVISASVGTGVLLWASCLYSLVGARRIANSLRAVV